MTLGKQGRHAVRISYYFALLVKEMHSSGTLFFLNVEKTLIGMHCDLWTNTISYLPSFTDGKVFTSNVNWSEFCGFLHFKGTWHNLKRGVILENKSWLHSFNAWLLRWLGSLHNHALNRSDQITMWMKSWVLCKSKVVEYSLSPTGQWLCAIPIQKHSIRQCTICNRESVQYAQ